MDPERGQPIHRGNRLGLVLVAVGVLGMLGIGYGIARKPDPETERGVAEIAKRKARFDFCEARLPTPPSGIPLTKRERRNLGSNVMGESTNYSDGVRKVGLHIGYDALDAAEDIDLAEQGSVFAGGRDFLLVRSKPLPDIWAATAQSGLLTPCDQITVFTRGLSRSELVSLASQVRVRRRSR